MATSQSGSSKKQKSAKKGSKNNDTFKDNNRKPKNNGISRSQSNGSNSSTTFITSKKSKKAKSKQKKASRKGSVADQNVKSDNGYNTLKNDDDQSDIDSDDEVINISSASSIEGDDSEEDDDDEESDSRSATNADRNIILLDSDVDEDDDKDEQPPLKRQKVAPSNMNDDYIAFDDSSDDENDESKSNIKDDYSAYDDNEYLSNDEGSYHSKNVDHRAGAVNDDFPWIKNSDHSKEREMSDWLTSEIKDFVKYISPSADEIKNRNKVIKNLREHITSMWPDAELHCFGSFATDLYLPGSDIDCVVISKRAKYDNKSSLYQLTSYIRNHNLGVEVTPIAKAKVPIIKFVDPQTRIHIDISFEKSNGLTAAKLIIDWLAKTPGLRELVLIVKHFLAVRKLNEVHVGGLGGFSIICLVYSFLKLHPRLSTNNIDPLDNLGCLLIEFFELYGYNFGYDDVAISFTTDKEPIYVTKRSNSELLGRNPFSLAIQDPFDVNNNISRSSFNLKDIKRAFGGAFELLVNKCYELNAASYKQRLGKSILGGIIKYKGKQRDFLDARNDVKNVAFHAASGKSNTSLPPLPSEKAGINVDEYYMSDSFYSDDDSDSAAKGKYKGKDKKYQQIYESSQKPNKRATQQNTGELLAIKDEESDDKYIPSVGTSKKEPDFTDSDSDYDPAATRGIKNKTNSSAYNIAKQNKRDYWSQKSGNTF